MADQIIKTFVDRKHTTFHSYNRELFLRRIKNVCGQVRSFIFNVLLLIMFLIISFNFHLSCFSSYEMEIFSLAKRRFMGKF